MWRGRDWNHYTYTYGEGRLARVRFDVECAVLPTPDSHQACRRLLLRGAVPEAVERFEASLVELLAGIDCLWVGALRYADTEDLVFQVEDVARFDGLRGVLRLRAPAPLTIQELSGWRFFEDRVSPGEADWQRIGDREMVERHVTRGVDSRVPHPLAHTFIGSPAELEHIRSRLAGEGFSVAEQSEGRMVLVHRHLLDPTAVSAVTVALGRFSRSLGVVYDGWKLTSG